MRPQAFYKVVSRTEKLANRNGASKSPMRNFRDKIDAMLDLKADGLNNEPFLMACETVRRELSDQDRPRFELTHQRYVVISAVSQCSWWREAIQSQVMTGGIYERTVQALSSGSCDYSAYLKPAGVCNAFDLAAYSLEWGPASQFCESMYRGGLFRG